MVVVHLTIHKSALSEPLVQVSKAVNPRNPFSVMTGILFVASKSGLRLVGSDTSISITRNISADELNVIRLGSAVLPATKLVEVISSLPNTLIDINMKGKTALITAGRTKVELIGLDSDEYTHRNVTQIDSFQVPGDVFRSMVKRTVFAACQKDQSMPAITGVRITANSGRLYMTATDRKRIAKVSAVIEATAESEFILSVSHINKAADLFAGSEPINISVSDNQAILSNERIIVQAHILNGVFPRVEQMLEMESKAEMWLNTSAIADAVRLVTITATEDSVMMTMNKEEIRMFGRGEAGRIDDYITPKNYQGEPVRVALAGKFLLDALKAVEGQEFLLRCGGGRSPVIISGADQSEAAFVIAPHIAKEEDWA